MAILVWPIKGRHTLTDPNEARKISSMNKNTRATVYDLVLPRSPAVSPIMDQY